VALAYLGANAAFAGAYLALGNAIENARAENFWDASFFSVQTMATIGYGKMAPRTLGANALVAVEALVGMMGLAVVSPYDKVPSLMFRMANERANQIVEAQLHAVLVRNEKTAEGDPVRRVHDLALRRSRSALFALTWTAIHPLTPQSPLFGEDAESMAEKEADIIVSLTGYDESLAQTVHARHAYGPEQVVWGVRFRDILLRLPNGIRAIDYRRFHDVAPFGPEDREEREPGGKRARG
jgi:inward rectifier potassium channel